MRHLILVATAPAVVVTYDHIVAGRLNGELSLSVTSFGLLEVLGRLSLSPSTEVHVFRNK